MSVSNLTIQEFEAVNKDGELVMFNQVLGHPVHPTAILLSKKNADGTRMNQDQMWEWLAKPEQADWKQRLVYVPDGEYGAYYTIQSAKPVAGGRSLG